MKCLHFMMILELYNKIFLTDLLFLIKIKAADKSHSYKKRLYFH